MVLKSIKKRDKSDKQRKFGKLKKTKESILINTNKLSVEEVANNIVYQAEKYVDQLNSLHFEKFDSFCTNVLSKNNQYGVFVGLDIYKYLPEVMNKIINKQKVYLLSDDDLMF